MDKRVAVGVKEPAHAVGFEGGWEVCAVDACPGELSKEILRGVEIARKGLTGLVVIFNARRVSIGSVVTVSCPDAVEAAFERCG